MVMRVRLLRISVSTRWMMMLLRAVLILSLITFVDKESAVPSRLMMSFLSRRERPFFGEGVAFVVGGGTTEGVGFADGWGFFFFLPATWAQVPEGAVGAGVGAGGGGGGGGGGGVGVGSGVDPEAFGAIGPVRRMGSRPCLCLLVRAAMGERRGSSCRTFLLLVIISIFFCAEAKKVLVELCAVVSRSS
jgi:hypothetical protein